MNTADRRAEIISILMVRRRITAKELAEEFNVTVRTIQNDIQALSLGLGEWIRHKYLLICCRKSMLMRI